MTTNESIDRLLDDLARRLAERGMHPPTDPTASPKPGGKRPAFEKRETHPKG